MPIHIPGYRNRKNKIQAPQRNVVAVLQLTAMVDMFTVLVVFLLQNYASTNQILPISDVVQLPKATSIIQLKPSLVVILSKKELKFKGETLVTFAAIKRQKNWIIEPLKQVVMLNLEEERKNVKKKDPNRVVSISTIQDFEKMTLQADESIDFLTIKKIMYTLTEAGIREINFAVVQIKEYTS